MFWGELRETQDCGQLGLKWLWPEYRQLWEAKAMLMRLLIDKRCHPGTDSESHPVTQQQGKGLCELFLYPAETTWPVWKKPHLGRRAPQTLPDHS